MFDAMVVRTQSLLSVSEPWLPLAEQAFARAALSRLTTRGQRTVVVGGITYLAGPEGIGKSCLTRAAIRDIRRAQPRCPALIATAAELSTELLAAHQGQNLAETIEQFVKLKILVCDDLQELEGQRDAQELLLELVDTLLANGTSVLLTSRKLPGELRDFSPRWISRCHGGLCATIPPLGRNSRLEFLMHQAPLRGLMVAEPRQSTFAWLADHLVGSPRELDSVLRRLAQQSSSSRTLVDVPFLERWWSEATPTLQPTLELILNVVAAEFGITAEELRSRSRHQALIIPRQCAMYLVREFTGEPLEAIGRFFGERTHTTVSHCLSRLKEILPNAPTLRQQVQRLRKRITNAQSECA